MLQPPCLALTQLSWAKRLLCQAKSAWFWDRQLHRATSCRQLGHLVFDIRQGVFRESRSQGIQKPGLFEGTTSISFAGSCQDMVDMVRREHWAMQDYPRRLEYSTTGASFASHPASWLQNLVISL